jgi:hypothetical protein
MHKKREFLNNSVIIAAHAGDEVLWFSSIVQHVEEIITVYRDFWADPGIGARRSAALSEYPRGDISCLGISEAGAYGCADWADPVVTSKGIQLGFEANKRAITRIARKSLPKVPVLDRAQAAAKSVARGYKDNFQAIYDRLKGRLTADMNVFTHNPWGEYGHEENVQVFRVLQKLREEIGFTLWMSNYCTDRAAPLAMRYFVACPGGYVRQETDKGFAARVSDLYKKHNCWTWADDWAWFDDECFMEAPRTDAGVAPHHHLFPLNFFTIDGVRSRNWLPVALTVTVATAAFGVARAE